jgi:hypothetical protein
MRDRPYFLWDLPVSDAELRERLRDPDPGIRAQWQGRVMREARPDEVWQFLSLVEIVRDWQYLEKHLGRRREFWKWLMKGWREDGLLLT